MQIVDKDGNIFGNGLEVTGPDGKPKTTGGGGSPTGPAGGDLSGSYPNPGVVWNNGIPTYDLQYYSITNPSGFITSATAAATYQPLLTLTTTGSSGPATLTGSTLNIPQYGGGLTVGTTPITSGTVGRILFEGTGNVLQQSANLFWDNTNSRLGIGTASPSATLHTVGSITASGAIARGNYMQPTLVASANNDVLVGLAINPTFTLSGKTGVTQRYANFGSEFFFNANDGTNPPTLNITSNTFGSKILLNYGSLTAAGGRLAIATLGAQDLTLGTNNAERVRIAATTGNFLINTTTDAGYKLDVNGTARVQGMTTISGTFMNVPAISTTGFYIQPYSANNIVLGFNTYFNNSYKAISNGYIYYINQDAANFRLFGSNASVSAGSTSTMLTHFDFNNSESKLFNGKLNSNSSTYFDFLIGNGANLNTNFIKISYGAGSGYSHYFVSRHDASISSIQNQISLYLNNSTTSTGSSAPNTGNVLNNTQSVISSTFFQPTLFKIGGSVTDTATSSAAVEIASTTKGFLPPRMTTTQKNAIATPAAGLVVYDTTLNKLCVYTTAWETITSV